VPDTVEEMGREPPSPSFGPWGTSRWISRFSMGGGVAQTVALQAHGTRTTVILGRNGPTGWRRPSMRSPESLSWPTSRLR